MRVVAAEVTSKQVPHVARTQNAGKYTIFGRVIHGLEVLDAMEVAFREFKIVVEPGGAVALAAALTGKLPVKGRNVAVICSGGNVDHATFIRALSRAKAA